MDMKNYCHDLEVMALHLGRVECVVLEPKVLIIT